MNEAQTMELAAETMRRVAMVQAAVARANIQLVGMQATNAERASNGMAPAYDEEAFFSVINEEGLSPNSVVATLNT